MTPTPGQPSLFSRTLTMYETVLSGTNTNSGDRILVAAGIAGVAGLIFLPGYWKLVALMVPVAIYSFASQS